MFCKILKCYISFIGKTIEYVNVEEYATYRLISRVSKFLKFINRNLLLERNSYIIDVMQLHASWYYQTILKWYWLVKICKVIFKFKLYGLTVDYASLIKLYEIAVTYIIIMQIIASYDARKHLRNWQRMNNYCFHKLLYSRSMLRIEREKMIDDILIIYHWRIVCILTSFSNTINRNHCNTGTDK